MVEPKKKGKKGDGGGGDSAAKKGKKKDGSDGKVKDKGGGDKKKGVKDGKKGKTGKNDSKKKKKKGKEGESSDKPLPWYEKVLDFFLIPLGLRKKRVKKRKMSTWAKKRADSNFGKIKARMVVQQRYDSESEDEWTEEDRAAIKIQKVGRRHIARYICQRKWTEVTHEAKAFYEGYYGFKVAARGRARAFRIARKNQAKDYTHAMLHNAVSFVIETQAAVCIQRYTRGYITRAYHPLPWPSPPPRHQRPKRPHDPAAYRRAWARSKFVPKGGWPGRQEYIEYDVWEHTDAPPQGEAFGTKV